MFKKPKGGTGGGGLSGLLKTGGKIAIAVEVACFGVLYCGYRKINNDPETRYKMYASDRLYPFLDMYYQLGEKMNSSLNIREHDLDIWIREGRPIRWQQPPPPPPTQ